MTISKKAAKAATKRVEAHRQAGKQARLDQISKRRGMAVGGAAGAAQPEPMEQRDAVADEDEDDGGVSEAAAVNAAKRALAFAPSSQRSFHRELAKVLRASDVLLEVLDARDPMGCRRACKEEASRARGQQRGA